MIIKHITRLETMKTYARRDSTKKSCIMLERHRSNKIKIFEMLRWNIILNMTINGPSQW